MSFSREYFRESNYDPMCCHWNRFTGDLVLTVYSLDRAFQITRRTIIDCICSERTQTRSTNAGYSVPMWEATRTHPRINVVPSLFRTCGHCYRICQECCCRICHQPNDPWKFRLACPILRERERFFFFPYMLRPEGTDSAIAERTGRWIGVRRHHMSREYRAIDIKTFANDSNVREWRAKRAMLLSKAGKIDDLDNENS